MAYFVWLSSYGNAETLSGEKGLSAKWKKEKENISAARIWENRSK